MANVSICKRTLSAQLDIFDLANFPHVSAGVHYANAEGYDQIRCPANWFGRGYAAGPIRNKQMLDLKPDIVFAFPCGESKGTRGMIKLAEKAGIQVRVTELEK